MAGDSIENQWKNKLREKFPNHFNNVKVLDIGSADINGINKEWFNNCHYVGLDILPYKNVDVVSIAHEYQVEKESFDTICSTSELEHDIYWDKTLLKMVELLKPGGLMWFAAGHLMGKHGTREHSPSDSLTAKLEGNIWADYFKNITIEMVRSVLDLDKIFKDYEIKYSGSVNEPDLFIHFWGIKKEKK